MTCPGWRPLDLALPPLAGCRLFMHGDRGPASFVGETQGRNICRIPSHSVCVCVFSHTQCLFSPRRRRRKQEMVHVWWWCCLSTAVLHTQHPRGHQGESAQVSQTRRQPLEQMRAACVSEIVCVCSHLIAFALEREEIDAVFAPRPRCNCC